MKAGLILCDYFGYGVSHSIMKLFVIHRFKDRKRASNKLKEIAKQNSLDLQPIFLDSSGGEKWKEQALKAIGEAEAIIVFNRKSCEGVEKSGKGEKGTELFF